MRVDRGNMQGVTFIYAKASIPSNAASYAVVSSYIVGPASLEPQLVNSSVHICLRALDHGPCIVGNHAEEKVLLFERKRKQKFRTSPFILRSASRATASMAGCPIKK
ncbi:hypothetical protein I7I50_00082 [Histoplasma capsulatum G186AR]|uniref:Uncharacterized protein n=1 Tax=Ajellomyces capsulatus TaxID=5037 RepID=A0A8H8CTS1_AJECA|nr:hypothetical protein I7I52_07351 [Histoplasma capsulatum]QSS72283.1 hypothetical protein I7I50_00082 [Histoplasma capsulatum G186AR]